MGHTPDGNGTDRTDTRTRLACWRGARLIALAIALTTSACASLEIKPATSPKDEGLHFYRPAPYLAVSPGTSGCTMAVQFLPDYANDYVMRATAGFGNVTFNPTLDAAGNLTSLNGVVDSQTDEIITALGTVVTAVAPLIAGRTTNRGAPATPAPAIHPGLYKLNLATCNGQGMSCLTPVLVNEAAPCTSVAPAAPSSRKE